MNDEIALVEFAEIDLRAVGAELLCALYSAPAVCRVAADQFGRRKDHQPGCREGEPARECAFGELDSVQRAIRRSHDFPEAFDLAFGLEVDDDAVAVPLPVLKTRRKLRALCFGEHEIAGGKLA